MLLYLNKVKIVINYIYIFREILRQILKKLSTYV